MRESLILLPPLCMIGFEGGTSCTKWSGEGIGGTVQELQLLGVTREGQGGDYRLNPVPSTMRKAGPCKKCCVFETDPSCLYHLRDPKPHPKCEK